MAVDSGHTSFMLICMALVQLMLPGLAFFYAGLLQKKSVVTMMMQNFACLGVVTVVWFLFGFSLCFGHKYDFSGSPVTFAMYKDVGGEPLAHAQATTCSYYRSCALCCSRGTLCLLTDVFVPPAESPSFAADKLPRGENHRR